jgi:hypothetical protein
MRHHHNPSPYICCDWSVCQVAHPPKAEGPCVPPLMHIISGPIIETTPYNTSILLYHLELTAIKHHTLDQGGSDRPKSGGSVASDE